MFSYYLRLSFENIKRTPFLYGLVCLTLALGLGLLSANLALVVSMTSDPAPTKSDRLFHINMNTWPTDDPYEEPLYILRYRDAQHILAADMAKKTAVFYASGGYVRNPENPANARSYVTIRATTNGFFELTDAPFQYGTGFASDDGYSVVLSDRANNQLFGGENSIGKSVEMGDKQYRVVGVLKPWLLRPRYYHVTENNAFFRTDDLFMPLETAIDENFPIHARSSSTDEWRYVSETRELNNYFLQAWVELQSVADKPKLQNYLDSYTQNLVDKGQHPNRQLNVLHDVNEWIAENNVTDQRILAFAIVSGLFLLVCVFNASSLLLARIHSAKFEFGLRRAIGASKQQLLMQGIIESCVIGLVAGGAGMLLAKVFLMLSVNVLPTLRNLAVLDPEVLGACFALAIIIANLSNLYPLLRINQTSISYELK
jgi:putative ABC transport system permease protein